jgi:hypothetical protein
MENKKNNSGCGATGGLGLGSVLTIVFVVLKLVGVINWSWIWVLAPLWISVILALILFGVSLAITLIIAWIDR